MKKNIIKLFGIFIAIIGIMQISAVFAEKVDVFVPSSGRQIRPSGLAQRMENAAGRAYDKKNNSGNRTNNSNSNYNNSSNRNRQSSGGINNNNNKFVPRSEWM